MEILLETPCKQGKLIISEKSVQVVAPFNNVVWSVQRSAIVGVSTKPAIAFTRTVEFRTAGGVFKAETVRNRKAQEIIALFS